LGGICVFSATFDGMRCYSVQYVDMAQAESHEMEGCKMVSLAAEDCF